MWSIHKLIKLLSIAKFDKDFVLKYSSKGKSISHQSINYMLSYE